MATVVLPPTLSARINGDETHVIDGATAGEVLRSLEKRQPRLHGWILDETGSLREHVALFVNSQRVSLGRPVDQDDELYIIQAITGGAPDTDDEIEILLGTRKGTLCAPGCSWPVRSGSLPSLCRPDCRLRLFRLPHWNVLRRPDPWAVRSPSLLHQCSRRRVAGSRRPGLSSGFGCGGRANLDSGTGGRGWRSLGRRRPRSPFSEPRQRSHLAREPVSLGPTHPIRMGCRIGGGRLSIPSVPGRTSPIVSR